MAGTIVAASASADVLLRVEFEGMVNGAPVLQVWELQSDAPGVSFSNGVYSWSPTNDIVLIPGTNGNGEPDPVSATALLAGGTSLTLDTNGGRGTGGPSVQLNFGVQAGMANGTFNINSGFVNFAALPNALGRASATLTLTDFSGDNLVEFNGNASNDLQGAYRANYNGATRFAELFQGTTFGPGVGFTEETGIGFLPIGDPVSNISSRWAFSLSALDVAIGTSNFEVIPTPGTAALLGLAGLTIANRRRRR
jgi:hypothetical protein